MKFKIGDVVQIAPNNRSLDCCGGKRGRIYGTAAWDKNLFILNTDHFCPVGRTADELTIVPAEILASEYFEIEGIDVFFGYIEAVQTGALTLDKIQHDANNGDATCRHFLVLFNAYGTEQLKQDA